MDNGLLGKQFDILNGHLTIVDPPGNKQTQAGAPQVVPFDQRLKTQGFAAATRGIEPMQNAPSAPQVTPSALPAPGSGLAGLLGGVG